MPFEVFSWFAEEFHLHLIEFTSSECHIPRSDLISKGFTDIADTDWEFMTSRSHHVFEVDEDALSGLWTEIDDAAAVFGDANVGLEHHIELTDWGKIGLSANWALDFVLLDELIHLLEGHIVDIGIWELGFDELIGAVTGFASLAVDHWVIEGGNVSGSFPNAWIHKDASIDADVGW